MWGFTKISCPWLASILYITTLFVSESSFSQSLPEKFEYYECSDNMSINESCRFPDDVFEKYVVAKVSSSNWQYFVFPKTFGSRYTLTVHDMVGSGILFSYWWDAKSTPLSGKCGSGTNYDGVNYGDKLNQSHNSVFFDAEKSGQFILVFCSANAFSKVTFSIRRRSL